MDRSERVIDLKKEESYVEAYVSLRNRYREVLLTKPVSVVETREWLKDSDIEVRAILQDSMLLGVVILYLNRKGEIALFSKQQKQGVGSRLLKVIETVAREKKVKSVCAWVLLDNQAAKNAFLKNGYALEGQSSRRYGGRDKRGLIFRKEIPGD